MCEVSSSSEDCGVDTVRQDDCHSTDPSVNLDMQRNVNLSIPRWKCMHAWR